MSETPMPAPFTAADLGRLVMVRRRIDDDPHRGAGDVVGELEAITADAFTIRRRDDAMVDVPQSSVLAAQLVGVSPLAIRTLEGVAGRGWVGPDSDWLGQWWLRAAGGFTARANSTRPLGPPGVPLDDAIAHMADWYGHRGLPPQIRTVVGSRLDAALAHRGWSATPESWVQTTPLRQALARLERDAHDRAVHLSDAPSPAWLRALRGGSTNGPAVEAVLASGPPLAFAEIPAQQSSAPESSRPAVAIARATVDGAWVGITAVEVAPEHRRQGLARAMMWPLLSWAHGVGVRQVYLEVLATNEPALALYASLGFITHHRYRYRTPPG